MALQARSIVVGWLAGRPGWQKILLVIGLVLATIKGTWWCIRNPKYSVPPFLGLLAFCHWFDLGFQPALLIGLVFLIGSSLAITVGWLGLLLRHSEIDTWRQLFRGLPRLIDVYRGWPLVMRKLGLVAKNSDGETPPIVHPRISARGGIFGTIDTSSIAQEAGRVIGHAEDMAAAFRADRVIVKRETSYLAEVRIEWGRHLRQMYGLHDIPWIDGEQEWPYQIPFGITEDGLPAVIKAHTSLIIGGESDSGKTRTVWAILAGYLRMGVPIRVRVIDPSGVEFVQMKKFMNDPGSICHDYVAGMDSKKLDAFFDRAQQAMETRAAAQGADEVLIHMPTAEHPLDIMILDEAIPVSGSWGKSPKDHILAKYGFLGRKYGFMAILLTQAAQTDVLTRLRDFYPQRLAFRFANRHLTEAVLTEGAEGRGARCSYLDPLHDRGVGYMPTAGGYVGFRAARVLDSEIPLIAAGKIPDAPADMTVRDNQPHIVYRLFGANDEYLYAGITCLYLGTPEHQIAAYSEHELAKRAAMNRANQHRKEQPWGHEIVDVDVDVVRDIYPTKKKARQAETLAIRTEHPRHNKQHNSGGGLNAYMRRLGRRERTDA